MCVESSRTHGISSWPLPVLFAETTMRLAEREHDALAQLIGAVGHVEEQLRAHLIGVEPVGHRALGQRELTIEPAVDARTEAPPAISLAASARTSRSRESASRAAPCPAASDRAVPESRSYRAETQRRESQSSVCVIATDKVVIEPAFEP